MIYLRDLNDSQQGTWLQYFRDAKRADLLKAYENGEDIEVGDSHEIKDCKVV